MAQYQVQAPDGGMHVIEGPDDASPKDIEAAAQDLLGEGKLEAFGRAAVNNLPAGGQLGALGTAALKGQDYSPSMAEWNQKAAEGKAEHPIAYGAGAVTGSLAPLAIPGVGEALGASSMATRAGAGAALGGLNAVGNTDIAKEPGEALKQGAEGAVLGGAIGGLMPTGEKASQGVENYANRKAVQTLGLKSGMLGIPTEELEDLGSFANQIGATQGPLEQRVGMVKDLLHQTGAQVGESGVGATPLTDASPFIEQLHTKLQESNSVWGPETNAETSVYRQALANLSKPGLTFDELQNLKTSIGKRAFDSMGEVSNPAAADVYGLYKDAMKSVISGSPTEYQESMTAYGKLRDIHGALTNQWQREQAQGPQMKGIGMIGRMGGAITGGNVPATAGAAGLAAGTGHGLWALGLGATLSQNPMAMEAGARGLASAIPKAAAAATVGGVDAIVSNFIKNPQSYGKFSKPLLQSLQTGGKQGFAATSFVLRQQHPELNDMMLESGKHLAHKGAEEAITGALNEAQ